MSDTDKYYGSLLEKELASTGRELPVSGGESTLTRLLPIPVRGEYGRVTW